jgi:TrkA domain protein
MSAMLEVRETRLPGVGTKFTLRTGRGEKLSSVVHLDGMREIYHYTDADAGPHVITLNDEEARQLAAILGGVVYRPQLVKDLELALKDLVMEWIELPADSPLVGLTVATCRIRSTTGATIVAILRESGSLATPHPDEVLRADDTLVVIGRPDSFDEINRLVQEGPQD